MVVVAEGGEVELDDGSEAPLQSTFVGQSHARVVGLNKRPDAQDCLVPKAPLHRMKPWQLHASARHSRQKPVQGSPLTWRPHHTLCLTVDNALALHSVPLKAMVATM